jgi:nitrile hydratase
VPRFPHGSVVRVLDVGKPGHVRIPFYIRCHVGIVERYCGAFPNPEDLAYGKRKASLVDLYRIRFWQVSLWPDYLGSHADTLEIEIYDHWLAPGSLRMKRR